MKKFKVGLQLYSIRDEMEKDMDAALKKVKEIGYDYVEFTRFFDYSAEEVAAMLKKHGLIAISVHQGPQAFLEKGQESINYLEKLGIKYCAIPWYDKTKLKDSDQWEKTVKLFTDYSNVLKKSGITLMYHNHDFEFKKYEDKFLLDWIYETLPADVIMPQIDTCWVHYAGIDPSEYIEKYSGRMKVLHLKDFTCKRLGGNPVYGLIGSDDAKEYTREKNGFEFRPIGYGMQDFPKILASAEKAGIDYVIVEQDNSYGTPTLENAKISREYLKSLGL